MPRSGAGIREAPRRPSIKRALKIGVASVRGTRARARGAQRKRAKLSGGGPVWQYASRHTSRMRQVDVPGPPIFP